MLRVDKLRCRIQLMKNRLKSLYLAWRDEVGFIDDDHIRKLDDVPTRGVGALSGCDRRSRADDRRCGVSERITTHVVDDKRCARYFAGPLQRGDGSIERLR